MANTRIRALSWAIVVSILLWPFAGAAFAQTDYPDRRITFIVPHPAGAQVDEIARLLAQKMSEMWKQPIIVENKVGANGNLGAEAVARSAPDGYTLMFSTNGPLTTNIALFRSLPFDPQRDFESVALVCTTSTVIASSLNFDVKSVADLIARAKREPGKLSMGTGGVGTAGHFTLAELNKAAGIDIVHIPYRGSVQANADLAGGMIPLVSSDLSAMIPLIQGDKIHALAVAGAQRLEQIPDVPTVAETALPGFDVSLWLAVSAPRGTPPDIIAKLNATIGAILAEPQYRRRVIEQGCNPQPAMSAQAVRDFVRVEVPKWAERVRDAGVEIQ